MDAEIHRPKGAAARVLVHSTSSDDRPSSRSNEASMPFDPQGYSRLGLGPIKASGTLWAASPLVGQFTPPIRLAGSAFKWTASNRVLRNHALSCRFSFVQDHQMP
jgi:hypothetical protein